jgi:hypothetical protein
MLSVNKEVADWMITGSGDIMSLNVHESISNLTLLLLHDSYTFGGLKYRQRSALACRKLYADQNYLILSNNKKDPPKCKNICFMVCKAYGE